MKILNDLYVAFFDSGLVSIALWVVALVGFFLVWGLYVLVKIIIDFFEA
jgi:hypothetical protein